MKKLLYLLVLLPFMALGAEKIAEVEHGTASVILNIELYDVTAPEDCPSSDLTHGTEDLNITVFDDATSGGEVDFFECTGSSCASTDTIEDITTLNVFATPSANNVRFKVMKAGSCWYQFQFADAIFASANANVLNIEITAPGIIAKNAWVDLTPVSLTTLVNAIYDEPTAGNIAAGSFGAQQKTVLDAIDTLLNTVDANVDAINANTSFDILVADVANSGSQTTLFDPEGLTQPDDFYNDDYGIVIAFTDPQFACITDQDLGTNTITFAPALDTAVTTESYKIVPAPACLLTEARFGPDALRSDKIEDDAFRAEHFAINVFGATVFAPDAIGASELAASAIEKIWDRICETNGSRQCGDILALLLSEAMGRCDYNTGTLVWTCADPDNTSTRFTIAYGTDSGDRDSVTLTPP